MRLKINNCGYFFHPYEIAISGFSNTGKTTLSAKVISQLSKQHKVGYLKNDAHHFNIDYPGKDTSIAREAGAIDTIINDSNRHAYISDTPIEQVDMAQLSRDNDLLIIEGHKYSKIPKILLIGTDDIRSKTIEDVNSGKITNILAIITEEESSISDKEFSYLNVPVFQRDQINRISSFVENHLKSLIPTKVYGLVLSGGKSQRMKEDKGGLIYFEKDQVTHTVDLLKPFCDDVFVSCRKEQENHDFIKTHNQIHDNFPSVGPSSGILSAMHKYPDASWIILACDLPYVERETLTKLINHRNPFKMATCYLNPTRGWPEPLCTIYEPKSYQRILQYFAQGLPCPRKVLFNSEIHALRLDNKMNLNNINTPEEFVQAKSILKKKKISLPQENIYEN